MPNQTESIKVMFNCRHSVEMNEYCLYNPTNQAKTIFVASASYATKLMTKNNWESISPAMLHSSKYHNFKAISLAEFNQELSDDIFMVQIMNHISVYESYRNETMPDKTLKTLMKKSFKGCTISQVNKAVKLMIYDAVLEMIKKDGTKHYQIQWMPF